MSRPRLRLVDTAHPTAHDYDIAALEADQQAADARLRGEDRVASHWQHAARILRAEAARVRGDTFLAAFLAAHLVGGVFVALVIVTVGVALALGWRP